MKTKVMISLTASDRCILANIIDDKTSKRLAKRTEVAEFVTIMLQGVLDHPAPPSAIAKATTGESWRDHPLLKKHAEFIKERLKFHGYRTQTQIDNYMRAYTR